MGTGKIVLVGIAMVALGAIGGNFIPWFLFKHTEYHTLARVIGIGSSIMFLGGIATILFAGGLAQEQGRQYQRESETLLEKIRRMRNNQ